RADAKVHARRRQREIPEEVVGHAGVVVLPRVDEFDGKPLRRLLTDRPVDRSDLHVVRACSRDEDDLRLHALPVAPSIDAGSSIASPTATDARSAKVACVPTTISWKGMGAGQPARIASTVAWSAPTWPLSRASVRHRFRRPRWVIVSERKSSRMATAPPPMT